MAARTKAEWRRRARVVRERSDVDHDAHRQALARFLADRSSAPGSEADGPAIGRGWVVGYLPMAEEVDLQPLMGRADLGPFAVTRTPEQGRDLTVHPFGGALERHRHGFDQPVATAPVVADADIAVVLVPGVAFDRSGGRLGHGAGYYDRFLARLGPSVITVGVTGGYVVAELPADAHDQAMSHLCGPFGVLPTPLAEPEG